jgi:myo-inositol-1(or 4)-monophosphatase
MQHFNLPKLTDEVKQIAMLAADFIRSNVGKVQSQDIEAKSANSFVSYVDKTAEKIIVDRLETLLPEAAFITEEDTVENSSQELVWIVDPLDGTTNFLQGIPHFSVSIALRRGDEYLLGVVVDVMQDDTYHAYQNGGAFCNNKPFTTSQTASMDQAVIATGFPYYRVEKLPKLINMLDAFLHQARGIRRLGSAALDLTYVACGKMDIFYETSLNVWDIAAGIILVREAGGSVSNFEGNATNLTGSDIIASNGLLDLKARQIIQHALMKD